MNKQQIVDICFEWDNKSFEKQITYRIFFIS